MGTTMVNVLPIFNSMYLCRCVVSIWWHFWDRKRQCCRIKVTILKVVEFKNLKRHWHTCWICKMILWICFWVYCSEQQMLSEKENESLWKILHKSNHLPGLTRDIMKYYLAWMLLDPRCRWRQHEVSTVPIPLRAIFRLCLNSILKYIQ
jgi:hypothetical protein